MLSRLRAVATRLALPAVLAAGVALFAIALMGVHHVGDRLDAAARAGTQLRYVQADGRVTTTPPHRCHRHPAPRPAGQRS